EWGRFVNGGAWLTIDGVRVDLIYRDLHEVLHWTREARAGRFEVVREVGYVAGMASYVLVGELALNHLLVGELPRPSFPEELRAAAPPRWRHLARGALHVADDHAHRGDVIGCTANLTLAVLATGQARCAERAEWVLNEKGLVARSGLAAAASILAAPGHEPAPLREAVRRVESLL